MVITLLPPLDIMLHLFIVLIHSVPNVDYNMPSCCYLTIIVSLPIVSLQCFLLWRGHCDKEQRAVNKEQSISMTVILDEQKKR